MIGDWRVGGRWTEVAAGVAFAGLLLYAGVFVLCHANIVRNRFTDAWWHIAAAEEYAVSGEFARDPFIPDAPPFAQFGLMEFLNAKLSNTFRCPPMKTFVFLIAGQTACFFIAAFLAGLLLRRRALDGLIVSALTFVQHGHHGVIGVGLPFHAAVAIFYSLAVWILVSPMVYSGRRPSGGKGPWYTTRLLVRCAVFGGVAGVLFDLHAFTGLLALAVIGLIWIWRGIQCSLFSTAYGRDNSINSIFDDSANGRGSQGCETFLECHRMLESSNERINSQTGVGRKPGGWLVPPVVTGGAFIGVSWRWWIHHLLLRAPLSQHNAHEMTTYSVPTEHILAIAGAVAMLVAVFFPGVRHDTTDLPAGRELARRRKSAASKLGPYGDVRLVARCLVALGILLLFLVVPPVNHLIGHVTSGFMAERVCSFFPLGLTAMIGVTVLLGRDTGRLRKGFVAVCVAGLTAIVFVPGAWHALKLHYYLLGTTDYDVHPFEHLEDVPGREFEGRVILSDPRTSYFARGMIGTYAISVPAGHASPTVDYDRRDAIARTALAEGPEALGDYSAATVVVNRKNDVTATFCGRSAQDIIDVWRSCGWQLKSETPDIAVLVPPCR